MRLTHTRADATQIEKVEWSCWAWAVGLLKWWWCRSDIFTINSLDNQSTPQMRQAHTRPENGNSFFFCCFCAVTPPKTIKASPRFITNTSFFFIAQSQISSINYTTRVCVTFQTALAAQLLYLQSHSLTLFARWHAFISLRDSFSRDVYFRGWRSLSPPLEQLQLTSKQQVTK